MTRPIAPPMMSAWVARAYGGPEVLARENRPVPQPGPRDLLIRVEATTVSSGDRRIRALDLPPGYRGLGRLVLGFRRPRQPVLGAEVTGTVAGLGRDVTAFEVGDPVIALTGMRMGGHADYCLIDATRAVIRRPASMDLPTAAALSFGGTTALDYLDRAEVKPGERLLVIGGTGTVGSALIQLARHQGAEVHAVASTANLPLLTALGAEVALDYTRDDLANLPPASFDLIADTVGGSHRSRYLCLLRPGGRWLAIAGGLDDLLIRSRQNRRIIAGPAREKAEDLHTLTQLATAGTFRPLIDSTLSFNELPAAHARADTGRKRGSVVVLRGAGWGGGKLRQGRCP